MKRDVGVFLEDILESISRIEEYTKDLSESEFYKNIERQDAIVRRFEIIGEAVKRIPQELKDKNSDASNKLPRDEINYE